MEPSARRRISYRASAHSSQNESCIPCFVVFGFHGLVIYLKRDAFPFDSSLILIFCALVECVIVMLMYLRLCQSIDPEGLFGLTSAEKEARKNRAMRLG